MHELTNSPYSPPLPIKYNYPSLFFIFHMMKSLSFQSISIFVISVCWGISLFTFYFLNMSVFPMIEGNKGGENTSVDCFSSLIPLDFFPFSDVILDRMDYNHYESFLSSEPLFRPLPHDFHRYQAIETIISKIIYIPSIHKYLSYWNYLMLFTIYIIKSQNLWFLLHFSFLKLSISLVSFYSPHNKCWRRIKGKCWNSLVVFYFPSAFLIYT